LLRASVFNYERLNILQDLIKHPIKKLLSLEFAQNIRFQLRASRCIMGFIRTSESKVIAVCICYELSFSIMSVSIYYKTQSDILVKSFCRLNLQRASVYNYERLDILRNTIKHPSKKLLSFGFAQRFCFQFQATRYITGLNRTSELNVIVVLICYGLPFSITSVSIYYGTQSEIRVKSYCRQNFLRSYVYNFERLDILRDTIGHPS